MQEKFSTKLELFAIVILQILIIIFWYLTVIRNGIQVFNNLFLVNNWSFPIFISLFIAINLTFALLVFKKSIFLKDFFIFFNFFLIALEIVIEGYYIIIS